MQAEKSEALRLVGAQLAPLKQHFASFALSCDARRVLKGKVKTERKASPL
jgi:hypothetical protein